MERTLVGRRIERFDAQVAARSFEALTEIAPIGDQRELFDSQRSVAIQEALDGLLR